MERAKFFYWAERVLGNAEQYQYGEFHIPAQLTHKQISDLLRNSSPILHEIRIIEGNTIKNVIDDINNNLIFSEKITAIPNEGSIFPSTYRFERGTNRQYIIDKMQAMMAQQISTVWQQRNQMIPIKNQTEAIILASIVEKESSGGLDRQKVASVFLNRLKIGMPLQADPTIIYLLSDKTGKLQRPLLRSDWLLDSPYNTYLYKNLPPQPICIPSLESIKAVLNPINTNYLYFVADGTGNHAFARTLKEHNLNVTNFYKNRRQ